MNTRTRELNITLRDGSVQVIDLEVGPNFGTLIPFPEDSQLEVSVEQLPWLDIVLADGTVVPISETRFIGTDGTIDNSNIIIKGGQLFKKALRTAFNSPQDVQDSLKFEGSIQLDDPSNNIIVEVTAGKLPDGIQIVPKGSGIFGIEGNALEATVDDYVDDWVDAYKNEEIQDELAKYIRYFNCGGKPVDALPEPLVRKFTISKMFFDKCVTIYYNKVSSLAAVMVAFEDLKNYKMEEFFTNPKNTLSLFDSFELLEAGIKETVPFAALQKQVAIIKRIIPSKFTFLVAPIFAATELIGSSLGTIDSMLNSCWDLRSTVLKWYNGVNLVLLGQLESARRKLREALNKVDDGIKEVGNDLLAGFKDELDTAAMLASGGILSPFSPTRMLIIDPLLKSLDSFSASVTKLTSPIGELQEFFTDTVADSAEFLCCLEGKVNKLEEAVGNIGRIGRSNNYLNELMENYKSDELPEFYNQFVDKYSKIRKAADLTNVSFLRNYSSFAGKMLKVMQFKQFSVVNVLKAAKIQYTAMFAVPMFIPTPFDLMKSTIIPMCNLYNKTIGVEDSKGSRFRIDVETIEVLIDNYKTEAVDSFESAKEKVTQIDDEMISSEFCHQLEDITGNIASDLSQVYNAIQAAMNSSINQILEPFRFSIAREVDSFIANKLRDLGVYEKFHSISESVTSSLTTQVTKINILHIPLQDELEKLTGILDELDTLLQASIDIPAEVVGLNLAQMGDLSAFSFNKMFSINDTLDNIRAKWVEEKIVQTKSIGIAAQLAWSKMAASPKVASSYLQIQTINAPPPAIPVPWQTVALPVTAMFLPGGQLNLYAINLFKFTANDKGALEASMKKYMASNYPGVDVSKPRRGFVRIAMDAIDAGMDFNFTGLKDSFVDRLKKDTYDFKLDEITSKDFLDPLDDNLEMRTNIIKEKMSSANVIKELFNPAALWDDNKMEQFFQAPPAAKMTALTSYLWDSIRSTFIGYYTEELAKMVTRESTNKATGINIAPNSFIHYGVIDNMMRGNIVSSFDLKKITLINPNLPHVDPKEAECLPLLDFLSSKVNLKNLLAVLGLDVNIILDIELDEILKQLLNKVFAEQLEYLNKIIGDINQYGLTAREKYYKVLAILNSTVDQVRRLVSISDVFNDVLNDGKCFDRITGDLMENQRNAALQKISGFQSKIAEKWMNPFETILTNTESNPVELVVGESILDPTDNNISSLVTYVDSAKTVKAKRVNTYINNNGQVEFSDFRLQDDSYQYDENGTQTKVVQEKRIENNFGQQLSYDGVSYEFNAPDPGVQTYAFTLGYKFSGNDEFEEEADFSIDVVQNFDVSRDQVLQRSEGKNLLNQSSFNGPVYWKGDGDFIAEDVEFKYRFTDANGDLTIITETDSDIEFETSRGKDRDIDVTEDNEILFYYNLNNYKTQFNLSSVE